MVSDPYPSNWEEVSSPRSRRDVAADELRGENSESLVDILNRPSGTRRRRFGPMMRADDTAVTVELVVEDADEGDHYNTIIRRICRVYPTPLCARDRRECQSVWAQREESHRSVDAAFDREQEAFGEAENPVVYFVEQGDAPRELLLSESDCPSGSRTVQY